MGDALAVPRACPFCGGTGPFSKEHWLPRDWGEYFPKIPGLVSANRNYDERELTVRIENLTHFDKQFAGICARCNNGWLREVDTAAKDVALDLALGHRAYVGSNEIAPLSASLYRAGLIGVWGQREQHGLPGGRFEEFMALRRPAHDIHILIGRSEQGYLFAGGHYSAVTVDGMNETAVRSLAYGGLGYLFVVVLVSIPELASTVARVAKVVKAASRGTLVTLWPNNKRKRVNLPDRRITHEIALGTELGVVFNLRETTAPQLREEGRLLSRYATPQDIRKQLRLPTRVHARREGREA